MPADDHPPRYVGALVPYSPRRNANQTRNRNSSSSEQSTTSLPAKKTRHLPKQPKAAQKCTQSTKISDQTRPPKSKKASTFGGHGQNLAYESSESDSAIKKVKSSTGEKLAKRGLKRSNTAGQVARESSPVTDEDMMD
jgi:hypothetical protein